MRLAILPAVVGCGSSPRTVPSPPAAPPVVVAAADAGVAEPATPDAATPAAASSQPDAAPTIVDLPACRGSDLDLQAARGACALPGRRSPIPTSIDVRIEPALALRAGATIAGFVVFASSSDEAIRLDLSDSLRALHEHRGRLDP